ncbi:Thymidylate kinase [Tepidanaerobacter acetatoxydans Re1]|uniref:Thymidylate kinase n=1 Tax=Tepidanaerobacter acetatoxydans (strain DSM 21804 / JCM 16047 / Re1) TaxID=1209989 RepID=F4LRG2_TEPAE|nr:dTMP kinase [Tepidanaerobacter acetatoxydans]AEE90225.1 Thymidylate kinase [Tepidanaerobacter acetatoxydans Re1]CCP24687.2 Thymidylate kinase [Tepidanaerobacter acetatoxydans Re1]
MKGKLITIEGPDGAGKTTQVKKISEYLRTKGFKVLVTREPGGTSLGEKLRKLLLTLEGESPVPEAEALIYAASRAQLVKKVIVPALEDGYIVLCDRFVDSSLAYQGWARGLGIKELTDINGWFLKNNWPDLTIILDVDPSQSLKRLRKEKDRLESENLEFHKKVREGFLKVHSMYPNRTRLVDASQNPEHVFESVLFEIEKSGIIKI